VALALRCFRISVPSLWIDEALTWVSSGIGHPLTLAGLLDNVHGPLYSLILHGWTRVAGDSETALRLPSALCGAALVPVIAALAARWLGREVAIPAAWLAAGSPFAVWYGQEARNYALLMLCVALAGIALLRASERPSSGRVAQYVAAAAAGLLTNLSFALLAPLHLRWGLGASPLRRRRWLLVAAAAVGLMIVVLPWVPQAARTFDWRRLRPARSAVTDEVPLRGPTTFHAAAIPWALHVFAVGYTLGPPLRTLRRDARAALAGHVGEVAATAFVFVPLGVLGWRGLARRKRLVDALLWLGVPALVVSYFGLQNFKVFHPRYLAVSYPAFLLVLAAAFADLAPRARAAFAAALVLLWGFSLVHLYFDPRYGKEDYRGALALVRARAAAGERLIALGADHPVVYYNRGALPFESLWLGFVRWPDRLDRELDHAIPDGRGAWIVLSRDEDLDPDGRFPRQLMQRYPRAGLFEFEGVKVWHVPADSAGVGTNRID
jgi:mannosyltransferase